MDVASFSRDALECFCRPVLQEIDYLLHYTKNINEFKDQARRLNAVVSDVKHAVEQAERNREGIKNEVQVWLQRANKKATEAQNLLDNEVQANQNHRCACACCSPDWLSRHKLSKQAVSIGKEMGVICEEKKSFETVSLPAIPEPTAPAPAGHFMSFESTKNAIEDILKALKDDNNNTNIVGVHGMGGVGKTTMVKQVAEKVMTEGHFHRVVMATVSQTVNLKKIQSSIADGLELLLTKKSDEGRAKELREKIMADKRILVILDDVWEWIDLSSIGIPIGSDLEVCESKILLTTRREHVCNSMGCKENRIHLNILSPEDSWDLFIKTANTVFDSTEFEAVAREVAGECQGLPLALVTVARALGDKDEEEWKKAARRLKRSVSPNPDHQEKVTECIKLSYDFLKDREAKACFLMCCLFPEDHNISKEVLARYGMGLRLFHHVDTLDEARGDADTFTKNLIDSGLLLKCDEDAFVKMHDVVRDTAKLISSSGSEELFMAQAGSALEEWPRRDTQFESYTALSVMFNDIKRLPDEPVCPKLQALLLQENKNLGEIPSGFFNRMNTLKVLDISGLPILSLPPSIRLLENLCTLYMDRCKSKDISILGGLKKLEILSLNRSLISTFPEELAELTELRMLDMRSCEYIQTISPNIISRLHGLEELYLQGSFCQWGNRLGGTNEERNASLEELINLPQLTVLNIDIEGVNCLPLNVNCSPKWEKFDICINASLLNRLLNASLSILKRVRTRTLYIDTTMSNLPDWFIKAVAEKAEMLIYSWCWNFKNILVEYDKGRLFGLKCLYIQESNSEQCLIPLAAEGIPNTPVFEKLLELHIHDMESVKEICVGQLPPGSFEKLKFLEVQQCSNLENSLLHSNMIQRLNNLEMLKVTGNSIKEVFGFEGLEEGRRYLERLKELRLDNLSQLASIWKGPCQFADFRNVKIVIVIKCNKLKFLFSPCMSQGLLQLEELWVEDCSDLDAIIQKDGGITLDKITLPRLKTLALQNLALLVNFYDGNSSLEFPFLEHLHVRACPNFRTSDFHSSKQVHFNNERHYNLLKKRLKEPEDMSNAVE
ncbi:putative disease resistance protein At4g27220 [Castanea sativa]|uniref:putative disease resistance protein At4g27220 n=1 Tax=Castanea sativa TaxID=21020 RepID=UPI003F653EDD